MRPGFLWLECQGSFFNKFRERYLPPSKLRNLNECPIWISVLLLDKVLDYSMLVDARNLSSSYLWAVVNSIPTRRAAGTCPQVVEVDRRNVSKLVDSDGFCWEYGSCHWSWNSLGKIFETALM